MNIIAGILNLTRQFDIVIVAREGDCLYETAAAGGPIVQLPDAI
jgi:hypothetical protein